MQVSFFLMTEKGYRVLASLIDNNYIHLLSKIIIGQDKNIENDYYNEIVELCKKNQLQFYNRLDDYLIDSEYSMAISWRWIINTGKSKLIVFHDSLLPKYRGFSPLVNMLINGERILGVTAIFASEEYDRGDIIFQTKIEISYPIKIQDAIKMISNEYIYLIEKIIQTINNKNNLPRKPQKEEDASYSLWRNEDDYLIDWSEDAKNILNFINAVSHPYKGAVTYINGKQKIRILDAKLGKDVKVEIRDIGKVIYNLDNKPVIVCGKGLLVVLKVVGEDSKELDLPFKFFRTKLSNKVL